MWEKLLIERLNEPAAFFADHEYHPDYAVAFGARARLPGIVGIIIGGMLIGPHGFHLIEAGDRMEFLSTIEVEVF